MKKGWENENYKQSGENYMFELNVTNNTHESTNRNN